MIIQRKENKMKKTITIEVEEGIDQPSLCEDGQDFVLFITAFARAVNTGGLKDIGPEVIAEGIKFILSEYLALTLKKKINPFQRGDNSASMFTKEVFDGIIMNEKMAAVKAGLPVKEVDGKVKLDIEKMV